MAAKNGDTVRVHYIGTLDDGTVFDSSREREPLETTLGTGMLISGFEKALLGMKPGDRLSVRILPEEAYGDVTEEAMIAVPLSEFPAHLTPEKGMVLQIGTGEEEIEMRVADVRETEALLDANHPLAGEALTFDLELLEIL